MTMLQLNPPLPVVVSCEFTRNGTGWEKGWAHGWTDYSPESHRIWTVALDRDGSCYDVPNPMVRMQTNWTLGRGAG